MGEAAAVVAVNGERYEAVGVDPSMTLLEFLRTRTPFRGPKLGCGEGRSALLLAAALIFCLLFLFFFRVIYATFLAILLVLVRSELINLELEFNNNGCNVVPSTYYGM